MQTSLLSLVAQRGNHRAHRKTALPTLLVMLFCLSACGQKGPLKLPPSAQLTTVKVAGFTVAVAGAALTR